MAFAVLKFVLMKVSNTNRKMNGCQGTSVTGFCFLVQNPLISDLPLLLGVSQFESWRLGICVASPYAGGGRGF
jgi:hypothetical protein